MIFGNSILIFVVQFTLICVTSHSKCFIFVVEEFVGKIVTEFAILKANSMSAHKSVAFQALCALIARRAIEWWLS